MPTRITNDGTSDQATPTNSTVAIHNVRPTLHSFSSTTPDGVYGPGSVINITATYDRNLANQDIAPMYNMMLSMHFNNGANTSICGGSSNAGSCISVDNIVGNQNLQDSILLVRLDQGNQHLI